METLLCRHIVSALTWWLFNILYYKTPFQNKLWHNILVHLACLWTLDTHQLLILYFLFNPLNRAEMLLSIRLVLDLKIWLICSLQWATQENNTVPGGPGYPDRGREVFITSFKLNLCMSEFNSFDGDRIGHQDSIKGTSAHKNSVVVKYLTKAKYWIWPWNGLQLWPVGGDMECQDFNWAGKQKAEVGLTSFGLWARERPRAWGGGSFSEQFILFNRPEGPKAAQVRAGKAPNLHNNAYNREGYPGSD